MPIIKKNIGSRNKLNLLSLVFTSIISKYSSHELCKFISPIESVSDEDISKAICSKIHFALLKFPFSKCICPLLYFVTRFECLMSSKIFVRRAKANVLQMCRLVLWVAALLILLKHWHFCSFSQSLCLQCRLLA